MYGISLVSDVLTGNVVVTPISAYSIARMRERCLTLETEPRDVILLGLHSTAAKRTLVGRCVIVTNIAVKCQNYACFALGFLCYVIL